MRIKTVNSPVAGQADKVYVIARNVSGATISANIPTEYDLTTADGQAVSAARSGSLASVFAGITDTSMSDSEFGLIQVYGFRSSAYISTTVSASITAPVFLVPKGPYFGADSTLSAATTSGHTYVTLLETITGTAGYSSGMLLQKKVFIHF